MSRSGRDRVSAVLAAVVLLLLSGCSGSSSGAGSTSRRSAGPVGSPSPPTETATAPATKATAVAKPRPQGALTLAFAGDLHFELHLANLLNHPRGALGPITRALAGADLAMVNLESSITRRGVAEPKLYHFRTRPAALDVLDAAGVDVVSMANNHSVDYGAVGLRDTLRAVRHSPVAVVGIGPDRRRAFAPHRVTVRGTDIAFLAASARRERTSAAWSAGATSPGIAAARPPRPHRLLDAVRRASVRDDVVVVYLHWGSEKQSCPDPRQRDVAQALADAGADIVVGSHAHVLQGAGFLDDTYVSYGLGNFVWYHNHQPDTGVLQVRVRGGEVVGGSFVPARIQRLGRPRPLTGSDRVAATSDWQRLRGCSGLASRPSR